MDIDCTHKYACTVGNDRGLKIFDIATASELHAYKTTAVDDGATLVVQIDPSGLFVATANSDRRIRIHNFYTGDCIAVGVGHSDTVTSLKFLNNGTQLVSVSADSCVFIWDLPLHVIAAIADRFIELSPSHPPSPRTPAQYVGAMTKLIHTPNSPAPVAFDFDWNALPAWARKQVRMFSVAERDSWGMLVSTAVRNDAHVCEYVSFLQLRPGGRVVVSIGAG